jgi:phosphoacetylglucosamine mutase
MSRLCATTQGPGQLNDGVGAEHVQKTRTPPAGFTASRDAGLRLASVDGDADRLVYHYFNKAGQWHLLDGDAIAALTATFFADNLRDLGLKITGGLRKQALLPFKNLSSSAHTLQ